MNVHSKSLRTYIDKHPGLTGMRLSMLPYKDQGWMVNKPLYAVGFCFVRGEIGLFLNAGHA